MNDNVQKRLTPSACTEHSDDDLMRTLDAMQTVIRRAVDQQAERSNVSFVTTTDPTFARDTLAEVLATAKSSVSVILPHDPRPAEVILEGLERGAANWGSEVRVRMLGLNSAPTRDRLCGYGTAKPWLEIRLTTARLPSTIVVDVACALVRVNRPNGAWRATLVRDDALIAVVHAMCISGWRTGLLLLDDGAPDGVTIGKETMIEILGHLAEGQIDEVAAREMAISVRTYRRYVADMMRYLGAASRFQAGLLASELGLTSRRTTSSPAMSTPLPDDEVASTR